MESAYILALQEKVSELEEEIKNLKLVDIRITKMYGQEGGRLTVYLGEDFEIFTTYFDGINTTIKYQKTNNKHTLSPGMQSAVNKMECHSASKIYIQVNEGICVITYDIINGTCLFDTYKCSKLWKISEDAFLRVINAMLTLTLPPVRMIELT
jgi:hypothetical protein